jgi:AraC-like DNA-binding protein
MFAEIHTKILKDLPFVLTTMGLDIYQKPMNRPEGFTFHQFIWVTQGSGSFTIRDKKFTLEKGEGIFIRAGVPHCYEGKSFYTSWVSFTIDASTLDFFGVGDHLCFRSPTFLDREAKQLLDFAMGDSTPISRSAAGYSFVIELFSAILVSDKDLSEKVLHLLEQKYNQPLTLTEIADELHVDKFYLCRKYKEDRGVTVMDDLNRIRITKAKRFLWYGSTSTKQAGKMCGFDSPSYFGKRFREATGITPAEYKRTKATRS